MNLSGSLACSISSEKCDDDTRSKAFQTAPCFPRLTFFFGTIGGKALLSRRSLTPLSERSFPPLVAQTVTEGSAELVAFRFSEGVSAQSLVCALKDVPDLSQSLF